MHFNKLLFEQFSKKQVINVDDILKFIYKNGNIKKDEHVIIFNNHCRGVFGKMPKINPSYNSYFDISVEDRKQLNNLRIKSGSKKQEKYNDLFNSNNIKTKKVKSKSKNNSIKSIKK